MHLSCALQLATEAIWVLWLIWLLHKQEEDGLPSWACSEIANARQLSEAAIGAKPDTHTTLTDVVYVVSCDSLRPVINTPNPR